MKDLESQVITMQSGQPVMKTQQLSGDAKRTKAEAATNTPVKYDTGKAPSFTPLGGDNKRN